jgi:hypothetical protein
MPDNKQEPIGMDFLQASFIGGMNLLVDDTRLPVAAKYATGKSPYTIGYNQYRAGFNVRNRFDVLTPTHSSMQDTTAPVGNYQGLIAFGDSLILFCNGKAYFKSPLTVNVSSEDGYIAVSPNTWQQIPNFSMDSKINRLWTIAIPVSTTNYARLSGTFTGVGGLPVPSASNTLTTINISATFAGNLSGLLVQDGINQPQFIFLDINNSNAVTCRTTQTYAEWSFPLDNNTLLLTGPDEREYVPIGTYMEWYNGILFIVAPDGENIYRSVSGRPLDFVINVDQYGQKGGDATTTSYSVGVGGITCLKSLSSGALFVSAGNQVCFAVTLNTTPNAPTIFGEYTFIRTFLFNAGCISDKCIIDILGDTGFIDLNGIRSFNAVASQQNEGRNSVFSATIQSLFSGIPGQDIDYVSAFNFDNYALFSVNTYYGYVIVVYDTINQCWSSIDIEQTNNHSVKQFAGMTIDILELWAITDDNRLLQLYASDEYDTATVRFGGLCSQSPEKELQPWYLRPIFANITETFEVTAAQFVNNRMSNDTITKTVNYIPVTAPSELEFNYPDTDTQVNNILYTWPNAAQGWKVYYVLSWTGGATLTHILTQVRSLNPMNPPTSQGVVV